MARTPSFSGLVAFGCRFRTDGFYAVIYGTNEQKQLVKGKRYYRVHRTYEPKGSPALR